MWTCKYKRAKNYGLLPKIERKRQKSVITTYALLNKHCQEEYQLHPHPSASDTFVMFNQTEYLQRQCSVIIPNTNHKDTIKSISEHYPNQSQTLTMFIANDPQKANQLLMGTNQEESIIMLAYRQLALKRDMKSSIFISIIGVENEHTLTDELFFDWLHKGQNLLNKEEPIKAILDAKSKINLIKQAGGHPYTAENISRHKLESQDALKELLLRYGEVRQYMEGWIEHQQKRQYYFMGEIYVISEAQFNPTSKLVTKVIKSHYIFRVNQYIRTTSPLLLRLGMNLKRITEANFKLLDIQDSKVFKFLSPCFSKNEETTQPFSYHLFLQIGEYPTLKEQHLCLAPTSEFLSPKTYNEIFSPHSQQFFYSKYYLQDKLIMNVISAIENKLQVREKQHLQIAIKEHEEDIYPLKMRLKTRSYHCDTISSMEKRLNRKHLLTEEDQNYPKFELEELVHETGKIYRLPSQKKTNLQTIKLSPINSKGTLLSNMKKLIKIQEQSKPTSNTKPHSFKDRSILRYSHSTKHAQRISRHQVNQSQRINYYQQVREWLSGVYGRNRNKKIKNFFNNIHKKQQPQSHFTSYQHTDSILEKQSHEMPKKQSIQEEINREEQTQAIEELKQTKKQNKDKKQLKNREQQNNFSHQKQKQPKN